MGDRLLTVRAAAEIAQMSESKIRWMCDTGNLRCTVLSAGWRIISEADLRAFLARGRLKMAAAYGSGGAESATRKRTAEPAMV